MYKSDGTEKTIEDIIRTYADMIFRIAYSNLKSSADAEDIFQEVCLSLITKSPPLDNPEHLKRWIIRVTINKCHNFRKSFWQSRTEPIELHTELAAPEVKTVMEELWQLPRQYRNVIYLYYYESYTISEIAQITGKSANTISSQLQRARKKLTNILSEGGKEND